MIENNNTILLVKDDVIIAKSEKYELEKRGYSVTLVSNGRKAMEAALDKDTHISLILMDIDLGTKMDGTEFAAQILKQIDIPVIFLTSHTEAEIIEKTEKISSYGYVVKSSNFSVLDATIKIAFKLHNAKVREKTKEEALVRQSAQQKIVATFGLKAYKLELDELFDHAVNLAAETLGAKYAKVLENKPDRETLFLLAGTGWKEGWVGQQSVPASKESQGGYTLIQKKAVILENIKSETRFSLPLLLLEHGVVCGIAVVIPGNPAPFGVFGVHHDSLLSFNRQDAYFMESMANILSGAIEQKQIENVIKDSLEEKETLLREIHHRVKNNMQVIISLLRMYSRKIKDKQLLQVFNNARDRVEAMSLIHESLYETDNMTRINFEFYLKKLCKNLSRAYNAPKRKISLNIEQSNVVLNIDQSIAIGMVITELVSNTFKHAFPLNKGGTVIINFSNTKKNKIKLVIEDDGKGLPPEIDIFNSKTIGLRLVAAAVVRDLGGSITVHRDNGTRFVIHFE